ncbi:MAG TPA: OmpH family outer membrane protein, partial [Sorangium sp.]|nr:OmpH family outer membrane protein [Sorangium sp.]
DRALADLQVMDRTFKQELRDAEWKKTQPLRDKVIGLIRRVASQSGYDMVVLKEFAPYFRKDLDITDRIIQLYNQSLSAETAPKKKAPAAKRPRRKKN